eukprot:2960123-Rhodomonas_salina.3
MKPSKLLSLWSCSDVMTSLVGRASRFLVVGAGAASLCLNKARRRGCGHQPGRASMKPGACHQ